MVYATYSKGFRPGGVNRTAQPGIGPYQSDYLINYEIGWKTQWFDHHLRWNGAIFKEDWKNFQFSFLGRTASPIKNGGKARIKGIENELTFQPDNNLTLSVNFTWLHAYLMQNFCQTTGCYRLPERYGVGTIPAAELYVHRSVRARWHGICPRFRSSRATQSRVTSSATSLPGGRLGRHPLCMRQRRLRT